MKLKQNLDGKDVIIKENGGIYDKNGIQNGTLDGDFWNSIFCVSEIKPENNTDQ